MDAQRYLGRPKQERRICGHQVGAGLLFDVDVAPLFLALGHSDYKENSLPFPEQQVSTDIGVLRDANR